MSEIEQLRDKYRNNGIFDYEQAVILRRKISDLMNEVAALGAAMNSYEDEAANQIFDSIHEGYKGMDELKKVLDRHIAAYREKFGGRAADAKEPASDAENGDSVSG